MAMAQLREVHMMNVNSMAPERGPKADGKRASGFCLCACAAI